MSSRRRFLEYVRHWHYFHAMGAPACAALRKLTASSDDGDGGGAAGAQPEYSRRVRVACNLVDDAAHSMALCVERMRSVCDCTELIELVDAFERETNLKLTAIEELPHCADDDLRTAYVAAWEYNVFLRTPDFVLLLSKLEREASD